MNFKQFIENPISNFELIGNWEKKDKNRGYSKKDIAILTSPTAVEKIKTKWGKTSQNFDLYFIRSPEAYKMNIGRGEEITSRWEEIKTKLNLGLFQNIAPHEDHITVLYLTNMGDEKIPLTAWMQMHRFAHMVVNTPEFKNFIDKLTKEIKSIAREVYGRSVRTYGINPMSIDIEDNRIVNAITNAIGTMKSARDNKLSRYYEFAYELLAQYLMEGKIKFNILPKVIGKQGTFGRQGNIMVSKIDNMQRTERSEWLNESLAENLSDMCKYMLQSFEGRIFML